MLRRALQVGVLAMLLGSALIGVGPLSKSRAAAWAWPSQPVQIAWYNQAPINDPNLEVLATQAHVFMLVRPNEYTREMLRRKGVRSPMLQYMMFNNIHDPGSCTAAPDRNQVAYMVGDYCRLIAERPDWFLRDTNNKLIVHDNNGKRFVQMDPGNAGWRQFFLTRLRALQEQVDPVDGGTWDGVVLDNVDASLNRIYKLGVKPQKYADDTSYQAATAGFLSYLYNEYFRDQGRPLLANITNLVDQNAYFKYLDQVDGIMEETWSVDWRNQYVSASKWEQHLSRAEQAQARGKRLILGAQGEESDYQNVWQEPNARQEFAFASYLLITNGRASFRYTRAGQYSYLWLYSNYTAALGTPVGARYKDGSVWRRKFTNGLVSVDPVARTASIALTNAPTITPTPTATTQPSPPALPQRRFLPAANR